jgi:hypothetical protein
MAGPGRIAAGQRLAAAISARAWNRAQDAADYVLGTRDNFAAGDAAGVARAATVAIVRNDSGYPVPLGGALAVEGLVVEPGAGDITAEEPTAEDRDAMEFIRRPVLRGRRPEYAYDAIVVALEPVAVGAAGRFAVGGVFPCKVRVLSTGHRYAVGRYLDVTQLVSAPCGPVRLLVVNGSPAGAEEPEPTPYWSLGQM